MQKYFVNFTCALGLAIAFTGPAAANDADLSAALAGKTLTSGKAVIKVRKNGRLTGTVGKNGDVKLDGAWAIRNGQWCRTIKEPKSAAGTECQNMALDGNTLSITTNRGTQTWTVK